MTVSVPALRGQFTSGGDVATSGAIALTANIPVGSLVLVHVVVGGNVAPGISDTNGHTWTPTTRVAAPSGAISSVQGFYTRVTDPLVAGVDTITVTRPASGSLIVRIYEITGVHATTPLGNGGTTPTGSNGNSEPITTAAVTPAAGDLALMLSSAQDNRTVSAVLGGFTLTHDAASTGGANPRRSILVHRAAVDATPLTPSIDMSAAGAWAAVSLVLATEPAAPTGGWRIRSGGVAVPVTAHVNLV